MSKKYVSLDWSFIRDKDTTMHEKLLFSEISQLSMLDKGCVASNHHFSSLLGVKKQAVSRLIKSLESKGYITSLIKPGSRNYDREITINKMLQVGNNLLLDSVTKCLETKENNTVNNNTVNNKSTKNLFYKEIDLSELPKQISTDEIKEFIDHRIKKKSPLSQEAFNRAIKQINKTATELNLDHNLVITESIDAGWQGIGKPEWLRNRLNIGVNNNASSNRNSKPETNGERINREHREVYGTG